MDARGRVKAHGRTTIDGTTFCLLLKSVVGPASLNSPPASDSRLAPRCEFCTANKLEAGGSPHAETRAGDYFFSQTSVIRYSQREEWTLTP